jgi:hypothetical protein
MKGPLRGAFRIQSNATHKGLMFRRRGARMVAASLWSGLFVSRTWCREESRHGAQE